MYNMIKNKVVLIFILFIFLINHDVLAKNNNDDYHKKYKRCWSSKHQITLLDTIQSAINKRKISDHYFQHDFIQTFGCAYEEDDIERNSIRAIYRAIIQSIRNRNIDLRDDLMIVLEANPPRPDNLMRQYSIYVNIPVDSIVHAARYEIKILDLEIVDTIESPMSVWTRIVTRFAYKEDFNKVKSIENNDSEFVNVMDKAQKILEFVERKKFKAISEKLNLKNVANVYPEKITDLIFGDSMTLFNEKKISEKFQGIFLGKGIFVCETPDNGMIVCKFGEERLYNIRIDTGSFRRATDIFAELNFQAPEVILHCLFLQNSYKKPHSLPSLSIK